MFDVYCSDMNCKEKPTHTVWFLDVGSGYCKKHAKKYMDDNDFQVEEL